jgi:hypothetical protein
MFENKVRRIFGPKREKVTEGWRRLHNEKLHNFHASPNIDTVIGWEGVDWIHLALDRDRWRAVMNTVINLRVP